MSRQRIAFTSACKVRRRRKIEKYRTSVIEFMSGDDNSRQNPGKKDRLKCKGETHQTRTLDDYLKKTK
ncbi:hypothetical protein DPMN_172569 [Dreissena polymorpha]|uniref:Uncharacterized protein n=1 Tax=Dreissena polymorpha TaxID=45954 RepID=A0A9D4E146_DREPO|nr:hypothetical protein DPMN_172569 [Dreissena polymorpha]